jgi:hypothetical protein
MRRSVPFAFVASLAGEFGAVECYWRESGRSFTGFVAEVSFDDVCGQFATSWARVVGYTIHSRWICGRWVCSVPVVVPGGSVALGYASRGSRVRLVR